MGARLASSAPLPALVLATAAAALGVGVAAGHDPRLGLALALGLAFAVLVFGDLLLGVAAIVLLAYAESYASIGTLSLAKLAGAVLVAAWLAAVLARRGELRSLLAERPGLAYLLALFLAWSIASALWARVPADAVDAGVRYALNIVLVPIVYAAVRTPRDVVRLLAVLVAGASLAGVTALLGSGPEGAEAGRGGGTVGDPNELAAALVVGIAVAGAFAVNRHVAPPWRLLAAGAAAVCVAGVLSSLSRGGLIGLAGALVCAVLVAGRWRGRVLAASLVVVVAAVGWFSLLAPLPATERVLDVGSGTGRLDLWTVGERMIDAHPVQGVGAGQFATVSGSYLLQPGAIERGDFILSTPKVAHNTYLHVTAELGLVGGALFAAIVLACAVSLLQAVRLLRRAGDERLEILVRGLAAGLGGYLVTLLFISEGYSKLMWALFALGPALLAVARAGRAEPQR